MTDPLFRKVDCIRILVPSLDEGLAFYRDRLGHALIWRSDDSAGLAMPDSDAEVVIHTNRLAAEPIDVKVESADAAAERIVAEGGRIIAGPFDIRIGRCVVVADPWGNHLVLLDASKGLLRVDDDLNVVDG